MSTKTIVPFPGRKRKQRRAPMGDQTYIGHRGDALVLLDEMTEEAGVTLNALSRAFYLPRFEALRDALGRGIT